MKAFQELTDWDAEFTVPNHVYFLNDSKEKMYAYIKAGTKAVIRFEKPMKFSTSGRKFKELKETFGFSIDDRPEGQTWSVKGSKGDVYTVERIDGTLRCSCTGFKYRGNCKHIEGIENE